MNSISMLATSKTERRAMFKKFAKSVSDTLPEPSLRRVANVNFLAATFAVFLVTVLDTIQSIEPVLWYQILVFLITATGGRV